MSLKFNFVANATLPLQTGLRSNGDSSPIEVNARVALDLIRIKPLGLFSLANWTGPIKQRNRSAFAGLLLAFFIFLYFFIFLFFI